MEVEITSFQKRGKRRGERYISGCKVYTDCKLSQIIDSFFSEHGIGRLPFKCKTWDKLKREVTKRVNKALLNTIAGAEKVTYSVKCGCSCGCSPGYNVSGNIDPKYTNSDMWVTITPTPDEVEYITNKMDIFDNEILEEIKQWEESKTVNTQ